MSENKGYPLRWVVSAGDYSDYKVMCICDSKKRAETVAMLYNADRETYSTARVEQLPFVNADPVQVTSYLIRENIWDDGTTSEKRQTARKQWPFDALYPEDLVPSAWRWVRAPIHNGKGGRLEVRGVDLSRVRRTFSDKRAQLKAEDAFRMKREATGRSRDNQGSAT